MVSTQENFQGSIPHQSRLFDGKAYGDAFACIGIFVFGGFFVNWHPPNLLDIFYGAVDFQGAVDSSDL